MKTKEMLKICESQKGRCAGCKLNCVHDWQLKNTTWCILILRDQYTDKYRKAKKEKNDILAEKIANEYQMLEEIYLYGKMGNDQSDSSMDCKPIHDDGINNTNNKER